MTTRKAPYIHADGSNCWTKNCSIRLRGTQAQKTVLEDKIKKQLAHNDEAPEFYKAPLVDVIAPWSEFEDYITQKLIRASTHPDYPYTLVKYTETTQFNKNWDRITMASRGLIVNTETEEIVARPFPKFFNYQEHLTPEKDLTGPFRVAEKLDGSLVISYRDPDGNMVLSTSGGITSEQGAYATQLYREKYDGKWSPKPELTYLYEVIYPQNRIVVDYGDEKDIYLLGAVNKRTGRSVPLDKITEWKWKRAVEHTEFSNLGDVANAPDPGASKEGYVVHFTDTDTRVKFKYAEYLKVHRLSTGLNERRIHEMLATGGEDKLLEFQKTAPEEFEEYIETTKTKFKQQYDAEAARLTNLFKDSHKGLPEGYTQKQYAQAIMSNPATKNVAFQLFALESGRGLIAEKIWESFKPAYEKGFWAAGPGKVEAEDA